MRIAVASDGNMVTGHFGHCEGFNIFERRKTSRLLSGILSPILGIDRAFCQTI